MRKTSVDPKATLAQIVLDHPECARVFLEHRLDFCCRGAVALDSACASKSLDPAKLVAALEAAIDEQDERRTHVDVRALSTPALVEHIVERHHHYLRRSLPHAEQLARKVSRVHGDHNPKLVPLAEAVVELRAAIEPHLDEEEASLFRLATTSAPDRARLEEELAAMQKEHLEVGDTLARIRTLADDYVLPDWACRSYRALVDALAEIERDTLVHVHLENHVLAPRCAPAAV